MELPDSSKNLWMVPNLLLQKFPAPVFSATTRLELRSTVIGERAGLIIAGMDYSYLALENRADGTHLVNKICHDADKGNRETNQTDIFYHGSSIFLRVHVETDAVCRWSYSIDGKDFISVGTTFTARKGLWIGAKIGLFAVSPEKENSSGRADYDWFKVE